MAQAPWWLVAGLKDTSILDTLSMVLESSESDCSSLSSDSVDRCGGSAPGKRPNKERGRHAAALRLHNDYFCDHPTYDAADFRRRFRMSRPLFLRIHQEILNTNSYFVQRADACGVMGLTSFQKMTSALKMLAYGISADLLDDVMRMGEQTILDSLKQFSTSIISIFGDEYLRAPTKEDMERILKTNQNRGFPGMMGSVDCMHWTWKNCPKAYAGQYKGKEKKPTIVAEAVVSYDLWFWHFFFGTPGANNDINVLDRSPLFNDMVRGMTPTAQFSINGNTYDRSYYLADGIYPAWSTFVKTLSKPRGPKQSHYCKVQEAVRKDVERAFGVLQARFQILDRPCKLWCSDAMTVIFRACVIMHNMIVEDERDDYSLTQKYLTEGPDFVPIVVTPAPTLPNTNDQIRSNLRGMYNAQRHIDLRTDLMEHLWVLHGDADEE